MFSLMQRRFFCFSPNFSLSLLPVSLAVCFCAERVSRVDRGTRDRGLRSVDSALIISSLSSPSTSISLARHSGNLSSHLSRRSHPLPILLLPHSSGKLDHGNEGNEEQIEEERDAQQESPSTGFLSFSRSLSASLSSTLVLPVTRQERSS